jgi:pimeloyl-ACP methyl ester carboxylesterase
MYVDIGGIEQWIEIGSTNRDNPILLFLHGGPGGSSRSASAAWRPWESHFTVVHWDQRGAGLTFSRNGEARTGPLTIERMVVDGIEVVGFLREHLKQDKVLLVGHSWGTVLGIHMVRRRPELFSAYVGTGQLVNKQRNEELNHQRLLAQAKARQNSRALASLLAMGRGPFSHEAIRRLRAWGEDLADTTVDDVYMLPSPRPPGFTPADGQAIMQSHFYSSDHLFDEVSQVDLPALGTSFDLPMLFVHGSEDSQTPIELAEEYFAAIQAPMKDFVRFEGCHHFVAFNKPDAFLKELLGRLEMLTSRAL